MTGGTATVTEIRDSFASGSPLREAVVDRKSGRIVNVSLLGKVSANDRVYSRQAMKDAARLYRGARFYIDHPRKSEMRDRDGVRSVHDLAGRVVGPRLVGDRVKGDLELLDVEPTKSMVLALAEQMPELVGNSHRASGRVRLDSEGRQVVEGLDAVFGVELVTDPASTSSLFEQVRQGVYQPPRPQPFDESQLGLWDERLFGPAWARGRR